MILLSQAREQELVDALADAFTPEDLEHKIADPLQIPLSERSGARDVKERARTLVKWAAINGVDTLVKAALDGNPSSTHIREFAASIGLLASPAELIEAVRPAPKFVSVADWTRGLGEAQRQVCGIRMTMTGGSDGNQCSGFLVGDDQVMTAGSPIVLPPSPDVTFAFDGRTIGIHREDPIIVDSDFVRVLRLAEPIARALEKPAAEVAVRTRGWISPAPESRPTAGDRIVVVQYADGSLRVSVGMYDAAIAGDDAIGYDTATYPGSLGAPCFDAAWRLVGIHIGGQVGLNRGRTVEAIIRSLRAKGYRWDGSNGVYHAPRTTPKVPDSRAGEHDAIVRGIANSIEEDDVWNDDVEDLDLDKQACWAWVEAAAVHATFDPEKIVPFGEAGLETRVALLLESRQVGKRWVLNDGLRRAALKRLAARGALEEACDKNPVDVTDHLDVTLGNLIHRVPLKPEDLRDAETLRMLLTAIGWLECALTPLPDPTQLRASLERATLLAPFQHLTRGFFAGREKELADLTEYCEGSSMSALFIHGPGGMGKSALLARFVLQNAERDPANPDMWRPFVYIDFDRPELDATNLAGVLLAMVRQLGPQVSSIAQAAEALVDAEVTRKRTLARRRGVGRKRGNIAAEVASSQLATTLVNVTELLEQLPTDVKIVVILDTLEEVQFSNPDAIAPLISLVVQLQERAPQLRPILAGRVLGDGEVTPMELGGLRLPACVALLQNELPAELATNTQFVARLAEIVAVRDKNDKLRGNPLSLRLAAENVRREVASADRVIDELDAELQERVGDAIVQGRLYERILGHVHDKRVAALAHPGLALRVITWELIRDVLAMPCGLGTIDEAEARELFDALAREVALVRQGADSSHLELRPDLRRIVREDLARDTRLTDQRLKIHAAAVAFYSDRPLVADRAEEIYHRLALGEDPQEVDKRWLTGIEQFLRDAVGELPPRSNAYLANRVGGVADETQLITAGPLEWEEYAQKRGGDLLKFGQAQKALDLLAMRSDRLPTSKLHYVESIARRMLPVADLAGAEAAAEAAVTSARASSNTDDLRDALEELLHVRRLRNDNVGVLRGLAELANLGDALGDDLVLLEARVQGLESIASPGDREQFSQSAVRIFNRLPDELVAKAPELSRRVAAQVGGLEPATLQRVLRVVGTGSLDRVAASGLHEVLQGWQNIDPGVTAFVPDASKSPREIASAARYLATTREMDSRTAGHFADWFSSVVSPKN
jgi:hypothetical protein